MDYYDFSLNDKTIAAYQSFCFASTVHPLGSLLLRLPPAAA